MTTLVVVIGILIGALGAAVLVRPRTVDAMLSIWTESYALTLAVVIRLIVGLILLAAARDCRLPDLVRFFGLLSMFAALVLPFMGRERVDKVVAWYGALPPIAMRAWGAVALALGMTLIYAGWEVG